MFGFKTSTILHFGSVWWWSICSTSLNPAEGTFHHSEKYIFFIVIKQWISKLDHFKNPGKILFTDKCITNGGCFESLSKKIIRRYLRGSIIVWLTSGLFCLDSAVLLMSNEQKFYLFGQTQTSQAGGQLSSDTSLKVSVLCWLVFIRKHTST